MNATPSNFVFSIPGFNVLEVEESGSLRHGIDQEPPSIELVAVAV
jgi:hypothetical protein